MIGASDEAYRPDSVHLGIFFLLKAGDDPAAWPRFWSGEGWFDLPADGFDTAGGRYVGVGFPTNLPALSAGLNGSYSSLDFSLSGVDATALRLAGADRELVNGADVHVGLLDLDTDLQPIGACDWLLTADAGRPRMSSAGQAEGRLRTITLPVVLGMPGRNRASFTFYSPKSQRARSSDDAMFDLTPNYSAGTTETWPK